jgi:hypothetical protein
MSAPHTVAFPAARLQVRQTTLLAALGLLAAIAASIAVLAVNGANHTTATTPATAAQATSVSLPQIRYLGPRQFRAAAKPQITPTVPSATTSSATAKTAMLHYCLGAAQRCLR